MSKLHSGIMEVCIASLLGYRKQVIVPNVSWGLGLNHECDMLVLDDKDRFTEIEIKVSMADLKADFKKKHGHKSAIISRLIYAFPVDMLEKALPLIPQGCGIIIVKEKQFGKYGLPYKNKAWEAVWHRRCKHDKAKPGPTPKQIRKFMELGCMRIWSLKIKNNRSKK